jgi:hypothetical protein
LGISEFCPQRLCLRAGADLPASMEAWNRSAAGIIASGNLCHQTQAAMTGGFISLRVPVLVLSIIFMNIGDVLPRINSGAS